MPEIRILHMETPSPYTRFGQKGIGEGGAIAPPAAITNAVNDALKGLGVELLVSPITPRRIVEAIGRAGGEGGARMKPVAFDYARPTTIAEALGMLSGNAGAKVLAGGQTLGPMLNLRLAQPALLVDVTRIPDLAAVAQDADAVTVGATVTHAAIEDGRITDPTGGFLARVARGIAYRAVRTRGTIGGSLANADPAADWLSCLAALGAEAVVVGRAGPRRLALKDFVRGAMETALGHDELLAAVRIPKFSRAARFGFHKICRKTGEFADAIGVAVHDPERRTLPAGDERIRRRSDRHR